MAITKILLFFDFVETESQQRTVSDSNEVVNEAEEDVELKPTIETDVSAHLSEAIVPVPPIETEDAPVVEDVPVVGEEEKMPVPMEQQVTGSDLPTQPEEQELAEEKNDKEAMEQSYHQSPSEEREMGDQDANFETPQKSLLQDQEEMVGSAAEGPSDVVDEEAPVQPQEEVSEVPFADQEGFPGKEEEKVMQQDSSIPWQEGPDQVEMQKADEFFISGEERIPQSQSHADRFQRDAYHEDVLVPLETREPWVMVDYPTVSQTENGAPSQDEMRILETEMVNDNNFIPEVQQEADESVYPNDVESADVEEAEDTPAVEVNKIIIIIIHSDLICDNQVKKRLTFRVSYSARR